VIDGLEAAYDSHPADERCRIERRAPPSLEDPSRGTQPVAVGDVTKSRTRLGLIGLGLLGLFRDLKWTDRFDRFCLPELTIETRKKVVKVYLDGEVVPLKPPLHYRNRAHALQVIMPAEVADG